MTNPATNQTPGGPAGGGPRLSVEVARHVASLSRLALNDATLGLYGSQLARVLEYVGALGSLEIGDAAPMLYPGETADVMREDVPGPCLTREALMEMAPEVDPPFLKVPRVLGESFGA